MTKDFILLNTSRGTVVDTEILREGLQSKKILGLGLDVWEEEPLTKMSPIIRHRLLELAVMNNVIITPHIAGYTSEALFKMSKVLADKILNSLPTKINE